MSESDTFRGAFDRPEQLREFYDSPMEAAVRKDIGKLDELCRRLIAAAPMLFVATFSPEGHADVSPRGGQPGFVTVLDEQHLAIPDATGNRRLDTLENVATNSIGAAAISRRQRSSSAPMSLRMAASIGES